MVFEVCMKKRTTAIGFIMLCMANFNNVVDFSENVKNVLPQNLFQNI